MLRSYTAIALRHLRRNPMHMGLSLVGLAVGLACFLVISIYVRGEVSYDRFHEDADRIYRVSAVHPQSANPRWPYAYYPHGELLPAEIPEISASVRIQTLTTPIVQSADVRDYEERGFYVEPSFFDVFDFAVLSGRAEALSRPNAVFLTPSMAEKYFGSEDPIGRRLTLNNETDLDVVGVVAQPPRASHIQFDFLVSLATNSGVNDARPWSRLAYTYVKLDGPELSDDVAAKLPSFAERHLTPHVRAEGASLTMTPLTRIHLFGRFSSDIQPQGDYRYVLLFSAVAFLVLLIACVNYVTLITARSTERAREVGIRKSVGATRGELVRQFFGEAFIFSSIAVALAVVIMWAMRPVLESLLGQPLPIQLNLPFLITVGATLAGVMLICGGYPALVLSRFMPMNIFKGIVPTKGKPRLRKALVVFQFSISIALIGGTLVVERQLSYVQETRLGFDRENVLLIETHGGLGGQADAFKQEILRHADVERASLAYSAPSRPFASSAISADQLPGGSIAEGDHVVVELSWSDYDYVETLGMEIVEGRSFSENLDADDAVMVINEAARDAFGWNEPLGRELMGHTVVGVVRDFHIASLREEVRPTFLQIDPTAGNRALVRLRPGWTSSSVEDIGETWASFAPSIPFDYSFLDQEFDAMYRAEQRLGRIFILFTTLAVVLACLGLFGVSAYAVQQRTKEIGIRKVLGATASSVIGLISKEFVVLVAIAAVIGVPIAYFGTARWLESFAYRAPVGVDVMAAAVAIALGLALLAVGSQALRAARVNPAESLRRE